ELGAIPTAIAKPCVTRSGSISPDFPASPFPSPLPPAACPSAFNSSATHSPKNFFSPSPNPSNSRVAPGLLHRCRGGLQSVPFGVRRLDAALFLERLSPLNPATRLELKPLCPSAVSYGMRLDADLSLTPLSQSPDLAPASHRSSLFLYPAPYQIPSSLPLIPPAPLLFGQALAALALAASALGNSRAHTFSPRPVPRAPLFPCPLDAAPAPSPAANPAAAGQSSAPHEIPSALLRLALLSNTI